MAANKAACNAQYTAYHNSGTRPISKIKWIVMHDTEGGTARSVAQYFSEPGSGGSAHLVVDDHGCFRCGKNTDVLWGAPGANEQGFHIEQCGYAAWTTAVWLQHKNMLDTAAYKAALHCKLFGIPPRFVSAFWLRFGRKGITTHAEVTKWQRTSGGHTDPGSNWPKDYFMKKVKEFYAAM